MYTCPYDSRGLVNTYIHHGRWRRACIYVPSVCGMRILVYPKSQPPSGTPPRAGDKLVIFDQPLPVPRTRRHAPSTPHPPTQPMHSSPWCIYVQTLRMFVSYVTSPLTLSTSRSIPLAELPTPEADDNDTTPTPAPVADDDATFTLTDDDATATSVGIDATDDDAGGDGNNDSPTPSGPTPTPQVSQEATLSPVSLMTIPTSCESGNVPTFRYAASSGKVGKGRLCEFCCVLSQSLARNSLRQR